MTQVPASIRPGGDEPQRLYSIGDLAGEFGVSPRALRFYEDRDLLTPQRIGGNRVYTQRDRARLILILRGKRLGFSLVDIKEMLDLYYADRHHLEQLRVTLDKGRGRIAELEKQLAEITLTLGELRELETVIVNLISERESPRGAHRAPRQDQRKEGATP
jgi:DNA-binding transcriptional MerR regulator